MSDDPMSDDLLSDETRPTRWTHTGYAQQIVFGEGSLAQVGDVLKSIGVRRVLLVTTAGRAASDDGGRVVAALGRVLASTFGEVTSHAPTPMVQRAVMQARRDGVDGIVSFGGGSAGAYSSRSSTLQSTGISVPENGTLSYIPAGSRRRPLWLGLQLELLVPRDEQLQV
jgi:hypothetical protein